MFNPKDRQYTSWDFKGNSNVNLETKVCPIENKMLVGDTVTEQGLVQYTSKYRTNTRIPGILVYSTQTYGRYGSRMLYKCIPDDIQLPEFLVPYKSYGLGFNKCKINKFVLFKFVEWDEKHPQGIITEVLGDIDNFDIYCQYQLVCNNLQISNKKFSKKTKKQLENINKFETEEIIVERQNGIIAIDPKGSCDFDDALGFYATSSSIKRISVYIANVPYWLEKLNLWDEFTERISTIYLPDFIYPMLPNILSDNICSLRAQEAKYTTCMDIHVKDGQIENINFSNKVIIVSNNYNYEDIELLQDDDYINIKTIAEILNDSNNYLNNINDSHDVVAYFMIMMNSEVGKLLQKQNTGIYRTVKCNRTNTEVPTELRNYINVWINSVGSYENINLQNGHDLIGNGLGAYVHVTSPIRRVVDLVNIILLQSSFGINYVNANNFAQYWLDNISTINTIFKNVKKVQNNCYLLKNSIDVHHGILDGFIIDIIENNKYNVYIHSLKLSSHVYCENELNIYGKYKFQIYVFMDENTLKKKIRLQLI
tara:strand:- start:123 stop:1736 length:1614 start_codon:yes stop_codon:yes gene_type:complete